MASSIEFTNQSASSLPSPAPSGKQILYANTDGVLYVRDENGVDTPVGSSNEFANTVIVNKSEDLPDELTSGFDVVYEIQCVNLDTGNRQFTATGGSCVIIGNSRFASRISSTITSGSLITTSECAFSAENLTIDAAGADYIIDSSVCLRCISRFIPGKKLF